MSALFPPPCPDLWVLGCHVLGLHCLAAPGTDPSAPATSAPASLSGSSSQVAGGGAGLLGAAPNAGCNNAGGGGSSSGAGRHGSLCVQQLLLRGLLAGETAAPSLHALAALAGVLAAQVGDGVGGGERGRGEGWVQVVVLRFALWVGVYGRVCISRF